MLGGWEFLWLASIVLQFIITVAKFKLLAIVFVSLELIVARAETEAVRIAAVELV